MDIATGDCASEEVVNALKSIESVGQNQYQNFVKTVIEDRTVSVHDTIKKIPYCCLKDKSPSQKQSQSSK